MILEQNKIKVLHVVHAVGGVDVYLRLLLESMNHTKFEHVIVKGIRRDIQKAIIIQKVSL